MLTRDWTDCALRRMSHSHPAGLGGHSAVDTGTMCMCGQAVQAPRLPHYRSVMQCSVVHVAEAAAVFMQV